MKRVHVLFCLLLATLALVPVALAYENPAAGGVLTSTGTSVNNTTTAVPFTLVPGATYAVQCDSAACIHAGLGSATTATCTMGSANYGTQLSTLQLYDVPLVASGQLQADTLSMISVSGTSNCEVQRVVLP